MTRALSFRRPADEPVPITLRYETDENARIREYLTALHGKEEGIDDRIDQWLIGYNMITNTKHKLGIKE